MCEFCGCGMVRASERAASKTNARGKPIGVGIVAVAAKSRGRRTIAAYSDQETRPTSDRAAERVLPSSGA